MADAIPVGGVRTPEHITLLFVSEEFNQCIEAEKESIARALHAAGVIPHRVVRDDVAGLVLLEIARDPLLFYTFQNVLNEKNVQKRYEGILLSMHRRFFGK